MEELYIKIPVQRDTPVHKYARPEEIQLSAIGELTHDDIIRYIVLPEAIIQHYMENGMMYQETTNSIYADITPTVFHDVNLFPHVSIFSLYNGMLK